MTIRELLFFLAGMTLGVGGLYSLPLLWRRRKIETETSSDTPSPGVTGHRIRDRLVAPVKHEHRPEPPIEVRVSPQHGFVYKGPRLGIVAGSTVVLLLFGAAAALYYLRVDDAAVPPSQVLPGPATVQVINIFNNVQRGIDAPRYKIRPYANKEVVAGVRGYYYYLDLNDARSQRSLLFEAEEYVQDELSIRFREAMDDVRADILRYVPDSTSFRFFVRGSADIAGSDAAYLRELIGESEKRIAYYPQAPGNPNQYLPTPDTQFVPKRYGNEHLPNLRASFVSEKLQALGYNSAILEGRVADSRDERERYATILLFVKWPPEISGDDSR